jgi:hypothetical protein
MTNNKQRTRLGAPALKYIKQVGYEMQIGRSISREFNAIETSWGNFLERRAFRLLDTGYQNVTKQGRLFHPDIKHYSGIPDFIARFDGVADCKCPFNMEKFCDKMEALKDYSTFKEEFPEDFWQLVSNLVLLRANGMDINFIESINYIPYLSELPDIRMDAEGDKSMRWLEWTNDNGLPWLPDGGHYKNINIFRFRVMERDVEEWTERIQLAVDMLTCDQPNPGKKQSEVVRVSADKGPKKIASFENLNIES